MQKIVIAAYHPLVIQGIITTLKENEIKSKVVGQTHSAKGLIELIKRYSPDVAIVDISITWKSGVDLLDEIKKIAPFIELHFIYVHPNDKVVCEYLEQRSTNTTYQYIKKENLHPTL